MLEQKQNKNESKKKMKKTKTYNVEITAFLGEGIRGEGVFRNVEVPEEELCGSSERDLEKIFHYGQNDFQPKQCRSVSVGDVIHYDGGRKFLVNDMGFVELGPSAYMAIIGGMKKMSKNNK